MSIPNISREPAGTPTGGRFAAGSTSESTTTLETPTAPSSHIDQHDRSLGQLNLLEQQIADQLNAVRTEQMKHDLANAVARADQRGDIPSEARYVLMDRNEDEVNDYGSSSFTPDTYLDENHQEISGTDAHSSPTLSSFSVDFRGDGSGPSHWDEGLIKPMADNMDADVIDLEAVRGWSTANSDAGSGDQARKFIQEHRTNREVALAGEIRDQVRAEFPSAHTVHLSANDYGGLTYESISDADGNTLHEMYETETSDPSFDDDLDKKVREMTQDSRSVDAYSSWPCMTASGEQDKHTGDFRDVALDLGMVDAKIPAQRSIS